MSNQNFNKVHNTRIVQQLELDSINGIQLQALYNDFMFGATGPTGPTGPASITGPTGPTGSVSPPTLNLLDNSDQTVSGTTAMSFAQGAIFESGNAITRLSNTTFQINETGTYYVVVTGTFDFATSVSRSRIWIEVNNDGIEQFEISASSNVVPYLTTSGVLRLNEGDLVVGYVNITAFGNTRSAQRIINFVKLND
jgi:hypothetical protein